MKRCYLVGAGDLEGAELLRPQVGDTVIAADGGMAALQARHIEPDLVLGDFDSLSYPKEDLLAENIPLITYPAEKDYTDMMLAAEQGYERGCRRFYIFGGTGGRMDHTLANIQLTVNLTRRGCRAFLYGKNYTVTAIHNGAVQFPDTCAGYFSVYAFSDIAAGISETGFEYEIEHFTMRNDDPRGISNEFCGKSGTVSVEEGTLLICMEGHYDF